MLVRARTQVRLLAEEVSVSDHPVERGPDLMAHGGQELRLRPARRLSQFSRRLGLLRALGNPFCQSGIQVA